MAVQGQLTVLAVHVVMVAALAAWEVALVVAEDANGGKHNAIAPTALDLVVNCHCAVGNEGHSDRRSLCLLHRGFLVP